MPKNNYRSYLTASTIAILPRPIFCELQPVTIHAIVDIPKEGNTDNRPVTNKVNDIMQSDKHFQEEKDLIYSFEDIVSKCEDGAGYTHKV